MTKYYGCYEYHGITGYCLVVYHDEKPDPKNVDGSRTNRTSFFEVPSTMIGEDGYPLMAQIEQSFPKPKIVEEPKEEKKVDPLVSLVQTFSVALLNKLKEAEVKHNFNNDWLTIKPEAIKKDLMDHIQKGDPIDVAAYCAFAWYHKISIKPDPISLDIRD